MAVTSSTSSSPPYVVRALAEDEWDRVIEVDAHAFGITLDDEVSRAQRPLHEPGRLVGAVDKRDTLAGIASAFSFELAVPGSIVPAAGVSWVGVLPVHRRKGVLRALMTHQLTDVHRRGREALAVLWASEPAIYGRFGYGLASRGLSLTVPRNPRALRADSPTDPALRLRLLAPDDWRTTAPLYDALVPTRPGLLARDERWHARAMSDHPSMREGRSALRCVLAEDDGGLRGYARYTTKPDWSSGPPQGVVAVREVIASDSAAKATLYRYLFDLDLMGTTELGNCPVDDPVLFWLADLPGTSPRLFDALHVRLVDVGAALATRGYAEPVDVVLEVTDPACPWNQGRWRLQGGPDGPATCDLTGDAADLSLSVTDLGAVYLGGISLADLAAAGRVREHRPGSLAATSRALEWTPKPWCPVVF